MILIISIISINRIIWINLRILLIVINYNNCNNWIVVDCIDSIDELRAPVERRMSESVHPSRVPLVPLVHPAASSESSDWHVESQPLSRLWPQVARPLLCPPLPLAVATSHNELCHKTMIPPELPLRRGASVDRVMDPSPQHHPSNGASNGASSGSSNGLLAPTLNSSKYYQ